MCTWCVTVYKGLEVPGCWCLWELWHQPCGCQGMSMRGSAQVCSGLQPHWKAACRGRRFRWWEMVALAGPRRRPSSLMAADAQGLLAGKVVLEGRPCQLRGGTGPAEAS